LKVVKNGFKKTPTCLKCFYNKKLNRQMLLAFKKHLKNFLRLFLRQWGSSLHWLLQLDYTKHFSLKKIVNIYPGPRIIKLIMSVIYKCLGSVCPGKTFQHSLMFVSKARAYPNEALFRCSTLGMTPGLTHKH
jgi:hypothetical protein